ncbi:hypothetical protein NMG60_11013106 [Bertholletia excelsa]
MTSSSDPSFADPCMSPQSSAESFFELFVSAGELPTSESLYVFCPYADLPSKAYIPLRYIFKGDWTRPSAGKVCDPLVIFLVLLLVHYSCFIDWTLLFSLPDMDPALEKAGFYVVGICL